MVITTETELAHNHLRWREKVAGSLLKDDVFLSNGQPLKVVSEITRFIDDQSIIVWLCLFVENTTTGSRELYTTLANGAFLVDTFAGCKGCC